jgi:hypothetical protein
MVQEAGACHLRFGAHNPPRSRDLRGSAISFAVLPEIVGALYAASC